MSSLQRALLYITRKKSRNFLLLTVLFLMSTFVLIGAVLRSNVEQEIRTLRETLNGSFSISIDFNNPAYQEERDMGTYIGVVYVGPRITDEMIEKILEIDGVIDYEVNASELVWTNLKLKPGLWANADPFDAIPQEEIELQRQTTQAVVCRNGDQSDNFRIGALEIVEGRNIVPTDRFVVVISKNLAETNNLNIGDTITVETKAGMFQPSDDPFQTWGDPVELQIVGIFQVNFEQEISTYTPEEEYADNLLYIDQSTRDQLWENNLLYEKDDETDVTFLIDDPKNLTRILEEVKSSDEFDISGMRLELNDGSYTASVKPLRMVEGFAWALLVIGTVGCALILYLIFSMWAASRKQEIGILLSVGQPKRKIIAQAVLECVMILTVTLVLTAATSRPVLKLCCQAVETITTPKEDEETYKIETEYGFILPTITKNASEAVHLDDTIAVPVFLWTALLMTIISIGSILAGYYKVLKKSPIRILQGG